MKQCDKEEKIAKHYHSQWKRYKQLRFFFSVNNIIKIFDHRNPIEASTKEKVLWTKKILKETEAFVVNKTEIGSQL